MRRLSILPALAAFAALALPLDAAELPAALEAAVRDAESRAATAEALRFAFRMHTVTSENEYRFGFDPRADPVWTVEDDDPERRAKMQERLDRRAAEREDGGGPDRDLLIDDLRSLFGERVELADDGLAARTYRFDLSEEAEIGDAGEFEASKHLRGEIALDDDGRIRRLRFFSPGAFRPVLVAKIKSFDLTLHVERLWNDGPYVVVRQELAIDGSAFFKSFQETVSTVYSDFEKR